jgi:hypothetical protein
MYRVTKALVVATVIGCAILAAAPQEANAQWPVVTTYAPVAPVVGFVPERRGLFGLQTVYRPVVGVPAAVPVATYAPAAPVVVSRPVMVAPPVTVAHPVVVVPSVTVARPVVVSQPVTTFYAPAAPAAVVAPAPAACGCAP